MALLFIFLLWSWFCHLLIISVSFCLWGWSLVWFLSPSSPDPCLVSVCVPFFSCVWFVSSPPCFLLSSLSLRRWGNPNPLRGFGVPLVFSSSRTRSPTSTRTSRSAPTPRRCPAPAFFFSSSPLVFWVGVFSFWSCRCLFHGGGSWSLVLVFAW